MLKIFTGQIGKYKGKDGLDITVKSAKKGRFLAPSKEIVFGHKAYRGDTRFVGKWKPVDDEQYQAAYRAILIAQYRTNRKAFEDLVRENEEITLLCYCPKGNFCHRHQAAAALEGIAKSLGIEVEIVGER